MTLAEQAGPPQRRPAATVPSQPAAVQPAARIRDVRLDFFRGMTMFIILIAHIPGNWPALWIPARFGFSDATEVFVFCSGMASAIAFGTVYEARGWWLGAARTVFRVWQVYWAHVGLFFAIAVMMALVDATGAFDKNYVNSLNLTPFFNDPLSQLPGLMRLAYVPNYFDILPMYLVILALMPLVVGAKLRFGVGAAAGLVGAIWLLANLDVLALPAEPWSRREWFFNPFGWQLVFFSGFALMRGWVPAPPVRAGLVLAALAVVLLTVPFAYYRLLRAVDGFRQVHDALGPLIDKTDFGLLRWVHFLALAYLAWVAVGPGGRRLAATGTGALSALWRGILTAILKVGQQSLAVFVFSMALAQAIGILLDATGRNEAFVLLVNLAGFAAMVGLAYGVGWFKSQPWRTRRPA